MEEDTIKIAIAGVGNVDEYITRVKENSFILKSVVLK